MAQEILPKVQSIYKAKVEKLVVDERNRIHAEINKLIEPLKLHLDWITGGDTPTEDYGFADEDGDGVDIGILENALNEYQKNHE